MVRTSGTAENPPRREAEEILLAVLESTLEYGRRPLGRQPGAEEARQAEKKRAPTARS